MLNIPTVLIPVNEIERGDTVVRFKFAHNEWVTDYVKRASIPHHESVLVGDTVASEHSVVINLGVRSTLLKSFIPHDFTDASHYDEYITSLGDMVADSLKNRRVNTVTLDELIISTVVAPYGESNDLKVQVRLSYT